MKKNSITAASFFLKTCIAAIAAFTTNGDVLANPLDFVADGVLGQTTFSTNVSAAGSTGQSLPAGVVVDSNTNRIYESDYNNSRILSWATASAFINGAAADLVIGQADFSGTLANRGGVASSNTLNSPKELALDTQGNLYVADSGNHRVLQFNNPSAVNTVADRVFCQPDFTTVTSGVTNAKCNQPGGVWIDLQGHLFVVDSLNHRVLGFDKPLTSDAIADQVWGQTDFTSNTSGTTSSNFLNPDTAITDLAGNLYVADGGNNRVLSFDSGYGGDKVADHVFGQTSFTTGTSGTTASTFFRPTGLAFDTNGSFYVSDYYNNRVLAFDNPYPATAAVGAANRVIGQTLFTTNAYGATASTLYSPFSITFDIHNNLYVADTFNNRTLRFDAVVPDSSPIPQFYNNDITPIEDANISFPPPVTVYGLAGAVSKVTVTLKRMSHTFAADLDIFLVGPTGAAVKLMSDVGSSSNLNYASLTFDDAAAASLTSATITSGIYKPSDLAGSADGALVNNLPLTLSTFNNLNPNGEWSLFIIDDSAGDVGGLEGWGLNIFTAPVLTNISGTPTTVKIGDSVNFDASGTASPNDALTYAWNFGDGTTANGSSVTHVYGSAGTFTSTVTLSAASGGSTSRTTGVIVMAPATPTPVPTVLVPTQTDLKPVGLTAKKSKGKLVCSFYVQNAGANPAAATTAEIRFGVASDSIGKLIKKFSVPPLAASAKSALLTLSKAPGGYKYCRAVVDSTFVLVETNEGNNQVSKLGK